MKNDDLEEIEEYEIVDNDDIESEGEVPSSDYSDYEEELSEDTGEELEEAAEEPAEEIVDEPVEETESTPTNYQAPNTFNGGANSIRRKPDQNTINRLRERTLNTRIKNNQIAVDKNAEKAKEAAKQVKKQEEKKAAEAAAKKTAEKTAKKTAEKAAAKAATAEGTKAGFAALASNPYFWIVVAVIVGILILTIIVVVAFSASDSDSDEDESSSTTNTEENINYVAGYEGCESVTVIAGDGGPGGTMTLDEYVAGVVTHEVSDSWGEEAAKAQAIAARTYGLYMTDNCTKAIKNSQSAQTYSANQTDLAKRVAQETSGQVLTYDGKVFMSEYGSWWGKPCGSIKYQDCSNNKCTITLRKEPNREQWDFTMEQKYFTFGNVTENSSYMSNGSIKGLGGHCNGMTQFGAKYLGLGKNYTYDKILKTFYSDGVEISSISKATATTKTGTTGAFNGSFNIRTSKPTWKVAPDSNYYYRDISPSVFQCVWYARGRIKEIVTTMDGATEAKKNETINMVLGTNGNGSDWYNMAQGNGALSKMSSSSDYTKPRPGALISWKWTDSHYQTMKKKYSSNCGHVAVVESVDEANNKVTISDGWYQCGDYNNYDCLGFRSKTYDIDYIKNFGGNYVFLGYVYVADYALGG